MKLVRYPLYNWSNSSKSTKEHIKKLDKRLDKLECVVFELVSAMGYAVTISEADGSYPEIKKIKK